MSTLKRMKLLAVAAAMGAGLLLTGTAQASYGTVTATLNSVAPGGDGGGVFNFTRTGGTFAGTLLPDTPAGKFIGICLETLENIRVGDSHTWVVKDVKDAPIDSIPAMGAAKALDLAKLITVALGGKLANAASMTNTEATALQHAVWEIVNETAGNPYNLDAGSWTRGSNSALTIGWFAALAGAAPASGLLALTNPDVQDFLVQTPIPAAAWLLGSGLLGLFGISRRRQRKAVA